MRHSLLPIWCLVTAMIPASVQAAPTRVLVSLAGDSRVIHGEVAPGAVVRTLQQHAEKTQPRVAKRVEALGAKVVARLWATNMMVVEGDAEAIAQLKSIPGVMNVTPDEIIPTPVVTEEALPATLADDEPVWSVAKVRAPEVWANSKVDGTGVTVGLIDTGIDPTHVDLAGKVIGFKDFVETANTTPKDGQGHGTHCAGSILGGAPGGRKIGMAPGAKIIVARVFGSGGASTSSLLQAMQWIMDPDGNPSTNDAPRIVSNSWGSNSRTDKSFWDITLAWRAAGMAPSFAAGNAGPSSKTVGIPGGYPHVFAAGATDSSDGIASFSSRGPSTWDGKDIIKPDMSAPGHGVISAKDGGGYRSLSGTSMACPHVSGLMTLLLSANPALTVSELEEIIRTSVVDLGPAGADNDFGTGRIDAVLAMEKVRRSGITGTVKSSDGSPIAATLKVGSKEVTADAQGKFKVGVPAGTHSVKASDFYHQDRTVSVTVPENQTVDVEIVMSPKPRGKLSGRVLASSGDRPLAAVIRFPGSPIGAVSSGADGKYSVQLPHGDYAVTVASRRHKIVRQTVSISGDKTVDFRLDPAAAVLIVDEATEANLAADYKQALGATTHDYHRVASQGPIATADLLLPYETVLWYTGSNKQVLPEAARTALASYLSEGGRLLITGQDIGEAIGQTGFYGQWLHAKHVDAAMSTSRVLTPLSDPVMTGVEPFSITGGDGANNQTSPDSLSPADSSAVSMIRWYTLIFSRYAAIRAESGNHKVIYFGFGLEAVAEKAIRHKIIQNSMAWLKPTAGELAAELSTLEGAEREEYLEKIAGHLGVDSDEPAAELEAVVEQVGGASLPRSMVRKAKFMQLSP